MRRTGSAGKGRQKVYRHPVAPVELWRGRIERLSWGGQGLARSADGRLLLLSAPLALFPGEEVEAEVRWKPRHGEGTVQRWLTASPRRAEPGCPVAGPCGGCDLQGAGAHAADLKRAMVEDLLHRQLPGAPPLDWRPAPPDARRHRIQLHWDGTRLGFHQRGSHRVVPVQACPAADPALSAALPRLQEAIEARVLPVRPQRWELSTGTPAGSVWASDEQGRAWILEPDGWKRSDRPVVHLHGQAALSHAAGGFFQVCAPWAMQAFAAVLEGWDLRGGTLYDLYGGVGLFTRMLGARFQRGVLVESGEDAAAWARINLQGLEAEIHCAGVEDWLPEGLGHPADVILLDPPRTGLGGAVCTRLLGAGAGTLVLVGCDGAAFCRDLKALAPAWRLEALAALDLFPLTVHVEFVALLRKA